MGPAFFMPLSIRSIEEPDLSEVVLLLKEFAELEMLTDYFETTVERLNAAMFGPNAIVEGLIANIDGTVAGFSLFYTRFSSFHGEMGLHIEDLYIRESFRGKGVGEAFIRHIARIAAERGRVRLDLFVSQHNFGAIRFYTRLGAMNNPGGRHFKFSDAAFRKLAE